MKPKTLVVKYTPRNEMSNTGRVLDAFIDEVKGSDLEVLDLAQDAPDMFLEENLQAYIQRNYLGQELTSEQKTSLAKMDRMTQQIMSADIVAVAYPMYNFSMPSVVKAWFDSVLLKGKTWDKKDGKYFGLMNGKKALAIVTAGGFYKDGTNSAREHALSLSKVEFEFMGFSTIHGVLAEGMNANKDTQSENLKKSIDEVKAIARQFYGDLQK